MSPALAQAVRTVLDHGRRHNGHVEISAADFAALAGSLDAGGATPKRPARSPRRDPAYEREMRRMFELAELDP